MERAWALLRVLRSCTAALCMFAFADASCAGGIGANVGLTLDAISRVDLPSGLRPTGARLVAGRVLVWQNDPPRLVVVRNSEVSEVSLRQVRGIVSASFDPRDSTLLVVDPITASVVHLPPHSGEPRLVPLRIPVGVLSATWRRNSLVVGGVGEHRDLRLFAFDSTESANEIGTVEMEAPVKGRDPETYLTTHGDELLVAFARTPYVVREVDGRGVPRRSFNEVPSDTQLAGSGAWVGLALLPLDDGYLRTFSDLRSDSRVLCIYSAERRLIKVTAIASPIGFVDSSPGERVIIGVAVLGEPAQLVMYRWQWHRPS